MYNWVIWFPIIQVVVFYFSGLYARIWRYTSLFDLYAIFTAVTISSVGSILVVFFTLGNEGYPRSVIILYFILNMIFTTLPRLVVRVYFSHFQDGITKVNKSKRKILLLIGAGKTGDKIARDILNTSNRKYAIAGFIDDNPEKQGGMLHGKTIFCGVKDLANLQINYDELLITMPSASGDQMRRIVKVCKATGKNYKTVPGLSELIDKEPTMDVIRDVSYVDLLGRQEIKLDMRSIKNMLRGKRVLITGAGGSIGSELLRQCLSFNPLK